MPFFLCRRALTNSPYRSERSYLEMGLFLLAPASDYRYSHYMVYTSVIALLLLMRTHLMERRART